MLTRVKAIIGCGLAGHRQRFLRLQQENIDMMRKQGEDTAALLTPYRESGRMALAALQGGGIDLTEAKQALDEYLAFMKPEAATAPPGG